LIEQLDPATLDRDDRALLADLGWSVSDDGVRRSLDSSS
jgi:hypothetical protein